jgi:hypothetical protein
MREAHPDLDGRGADQSRLGGKAASPFQAALARSIPQCQGISHAKRAIRLDLIRLIRSNNL